MSTTINNDPLQANFGFQVLSNDMFQLRVKTTIRRHIGGWLRCVLQGYYYFAGNLGALNQLRYEVGRPQMRMLRPGSA